MALQCVVVSPLDEQAFLDLPRRLYPPEMSTQVRVDEQALLAGRHPLSHYFEFQAYLVYEGQEVLARAALISYPEQVFAYVGYFEAVEHSEAVALLFETLKEAAKNKGKTRLVGPVNASFWLSYRMKLDHFNQVPFTGEPQHLAYYPELWRQAGFELEETYVSTCYRQVVEGEKEKKLSQRYQTFLDKGYAFISPKRKDWPKVSLEVYHLLSQLYANFPFFSPITSQEFVTLFAPYRLLLDFSMVHLAYKEGKLVGFLIALPDYGTALYGKMSFWQTLCFLKRRWRAKRYSVLYLGAAKDHPGLGSALSYRHYCKVQERQAQTIGALIHQGKVTAGYAAPLQVDKTHYGLFSCSLED